MKDASDFKVKQKGELYSVRMTAMNFYASNFIIGAAENLSGGSQGKQRRLD
jgi:hypothetical protein